MAMARGHSSLSLWSPWDSNAKLKQSPPNPPQQDSPIPCMPLEQTPQPPASGPSCTQWSEDLFCKPSQRNEPPIPGPSQPSKPHEDVLTCEPEPEVAPTQSTKENFAFPATPTSVIIINNRPVGSPLPPLLPHRSLPLPPRTQPSPPLNPPMRLGRNLRTCD
ncbi:hypothetical protein O181_080362 [Austropuccinia psidii MF-1]|uniref:Uncharacterized protein n=1 Tax=Austropuccinia psidii MF-1 TaxID=1389203 RepID=A0A9Q3FNR9_9BASI|nr:hypothetical protein [Austropuccinia psidii MF-1]